MCLQEQYALQQGSGPTNELPANGKRGAPAAPQRLLARTLAIFLPIWTKCIFPVAFALASPFVVASVRVLVRRKDFWLKGLQQAHLHAETVTPELLYRYRLPALVRGWERGLLRFLRARVVRSTRDKLQAAQQQSKAAAVSEAQPLEKEASGVEAAAAQSTQGNNLLLQFQRQLKERRIPVLILHGEQDSLVPIGNSCRLSAVLDAPLIKIADCGHTPAEEVPACFVELLRRFVTQVQEH